MKNKINILLGLTALIIPTLFGCTFGDAPKTVSFKGTVTIEDIEPYEVKGNFVYDIYKFVNLETKTFDIDLAKLALISNCHKITLENYPEPNTTVMPALSQLGFIEPLQETLDPANYTTDKNDCTFSWSNLDRSNENYWSIHKLGNWCL